MRKLALIAVLAGAAAIFPTAAFAAFNGTVVAKSPRTLGVATKSGAIQTVRTPVRARIGARVHVNGSHVRVIGRATHVRIHGVIVRRSGSTTFLAGGRSLLALRSGRQLASIVAHRPTTGSVINTTATVTPGGQLNAGPTQVVGQMGSVQVQALITAVMPGSITLSVNGQSLTVALPAGIQLPQSVVGQTVTLTLNLAGAQPVAADDDDQADDNDNDQAGNDDQGDNNDDQGDDNGGNTGPGGGDDGD